MDRSFTFLLLAALVSSHAACTVGGDTSGGGVDAILDGGNRHLDSDGDSISDLDEEGDIPTDTDGDGVSDYLDDDSDGDGLSDRVEAGDADVLTPPVDSDGDGTPDFQDIDSDGDSLTDASEARRGTDPTWRDTDLDGVDDWVEVTLGTDPLDDASNPAAEGDALFSLFAGARPTPRYATIAVVLPSSLDGADVSAAWRAAPREPEVSASLVRRVEATTVGDGCDDVLRRDADGDGYLDTLEAVAAGRAVCFDIVPASDVGYDVLGRLADIAHVELEILADGAPLETRDVYFRIRR